MSKKTINNFDQISLKSGKSEMSAMKLEKGGESVKVCVRIRPMN